MEETYPKGTFEALLVIAVDWRQYLQELQDALLIVEIGHLLKRLLNQFTQSFSLGREEKGEVKGGTSLKIFRLLGTESAAG